MAKINIKRHLQIFLIGISALSITACQTVNTSDRAIAFQKITTERFVGKSVDGVFLAFGPPQSRAQLSDGREVLQFEDFGKGNNGIDPSVTVAVATEVAAGPSGYRQFRTGQMGMGQAAVALPTGLFDKRQSFAIAQQPICIRRFVVTSEKIVESFNYQGKGCY